MCALINLELLQGAHMVISVRHLLAWLLSRSSSHSQHRRKLSLVVPGQGGRTSRQENTDSFVLHSRSLRWPELFSSNVGKK